MLELLKQGRLSPMPVEDQVVSMWAGSRGYLDDVAVVNVSRFEREMLAFMRRSYKKSLGAIVKEKNISSETEALLVEAIGDFKKSFDKK